ncbi:MAG: EAL domain-containing protein [Oscillospiraceae bacterium]|nr:EAL domain-containing protein [Oscillospiraceae bacterium]
MTEKAKKKLDSLFEAFSIIAEGKYVFLTDMRHDYSRWSQKAVDFFDLPSVYMENAGVVWAAHIHPDDRANYEKSIQDIFSGKSSGHDMQYRALAGDGNYVVCTCRGVVISDPEGNPDYFAGAILNHGMLSYIDVVTGLRSLYGFFDDLQALLWRQSDAVIMLTGISAFSSINDLYGYTFGNNVLNSVSTLLQREFANSGAVYRLDGTKFAIISHVLDVDQMRDIYNRIRDRLASHYTVEDEKLSLSINAGILVVDSYDVSTETLSSCLRYAYYESKNKKWGNAVVFSDKISAENQQRIEKLNVIRRSVTDGCTGFFLYYQPIVDAKTEELHCVESLIRWKNNEFGLVPPNDFIPVLEQDILFPELGRWILRRAMEDGKKLLEYYPNLIVNVNISYSQLEVSTFSSEVIQMLDDLQFPPQNLCLEITERCRMLDITMLKNMFRKLQSHGIRIALDDFGTGYSSIGLIRDIPVNTFKIDREYVKNVEQSSADQRTVQFITKLAESFGAEVCVEGVETADMRDFLRQYRISSFQGYLYSKPIPIEDLMAKYCTPDKLKKSHEAPAVS